MSQLRTIAWETNSQITEDVLWRGVVSSTVFYVVRTKNIKQVRDIFLQGFKKTEQNRTTTKKTDQHVHSGSVWPWHLERKSYHGRSTSVGVPEREAFNLYL